MADSFDRYETGQACRETYLQHLGELLRHSGIVSEAGIAAISEGAGKYYDEMLVSQRSSGFAEEADGLTSSRLTLLCDDDLELGLRLDALSHDLFERTAGDLWRLHLRFVTLIGRADLPKTDNPVGPKGISEGLFAMFRAAGADSLDRKLDLLDRLQPLLADRLPALYALLDEKLAAAGVGAAAPTIVSTPENGPPPTRNDATPLQRPTMPGFERVDGVPGAVPVLISPAALDRLLFRLDQLERGQANPHDPLLGSSPDLRALLPGLFADAPEPSPSPAPLTAEGLGVPDQSPEGQAIDSVDRLFRHLENDTLIPPAGRRLLAELQIPLIKLAIRDSTLFSQPRHPGRQLLDQLGQLLLGLADNIDPAQFPLPQIQQIIRPLREQFSGQARQFTLAIAEVEVLIGERQAGLAAQAADYLPLLEQLDRRDRAGAEIQRLYAQLAVDDEPEIMRRFLLDDWQRLLEQAWLVGGAEGADWIQQTSTLAALLSSFRPGSDATERATRIRELPAMLDTLRAGMTRLKLPEARQAEILDHCFERQTRALRPTTNAASPQPSATDTLQPPPDNRPISGRLARDGKVLHIFDLRNPSRHAPQIALQTGDWLRLTIDGEPRLLCVSHCSAASGRYLLFNPAYPLAVSIHPQLLAGLQRRGDAVTLNEPGLFARNCG